MLATGKSWPAERKRLLKAIRPIEPKRGLVAGVFYGDVARWLLMGYRDLRLTLVDDYSPAQTPDSATRYDLFSPAERSKIYEHAMDTLEEFADRIGVFRIGPWRYLRLRPEPYDFVFLDYELRGLALLHDLPNWWAYVRSGGLLMGTGYAVRGNDPRNRPRYRCDPWPAYQHEIARAVNTFAKGIGASVELLGSKLWSIAKR